MARPANGYLIDGLEVPGVTTICKGDPDGRGDRIANWAARLARGKLKKGVEIPADFWDVPPKEHSVERDYAARVGTVAHGLVETYLLEGKTRTDADGQELLDAIVCFKSWLEWWKKTNFVVVELECYLQSKEHMFAGTCDAVLRDTTTDELWMMDWKTSAGVYPEAVMQVAAYVHMWNKCRDEQITRAGIVNFTRNGGLNVYEWHASELEPAWHVFVSNLRIYHRYRLLNDLLAKGAKQ